MSSNMEIRKKAVLLAMEGISAADPETAIKKNVKVEGSSIIVQDKRFPLKESIYVIGAGKASGKMAKAIEELLGDRIEEGVVVVPEETVSAFQSSRIEFIGSTHPIPSEKSVVAGERIINLVKNLPKDSLIIALFSGGGSALVEKPVEDISIQDIALTSRLLMKSGADIYELNAVRKHLSEIKGGWLAKHAHPIPIISLLISDVVGDRIDTIASGPTAPDNTTFKDAIDAIEKYNLTDKIPKMVLEYISKGVKGLKPETPKPNDPIFRSVSNNIIASNIISLEAMRRKAEEIGYNTMILTSMITGEAREVGKVLAGIGIEISKSGNPITPPAVILAGGETTVTVRGGGKGGRNQELALSAALILKGYNGIVLLSIGSDGRDGPTDAAGAVVDGYTIEKALERGIDPKTYLYNNDSYTFFEKVGGLIKTGYTSTNVNDFIIIIVEKKGEDKN
ncbi:MAG: hypothetical protein B6U94_05240 [Thermofilum sp. ex4484_79]|nr:MAG: hypothetical protein B6U94_05240 [Thermofilum sp. ex4484_79]